MVYRNGGAWQRVLSAGGLNPQEFKSRPLAQLS